MRCRMGLQPSRGSTGLKSPNWFTPCLVADAGAVDGNVYTWSRYEAWASHTLAAGLGEGITSEQVVQRTDLGLDPSSKALDTFCNLLEPKLLHLLNEDNAFLIRLMWRWSDIIYAKPYTQCFVNRIGWWSWTHWHLILNVGAKSLHSFSQAPIDSCDATPGLKKRGRLPFLMGSFTTKCRNQKLWHDSLELILKGKKSLTSIERCL